MKDLPCISGLIKAMTEMVIYFLGSILAKELSHHYLSQGKIYHLRTRSVSKYAETFSHLIKNPRSEFKSYLT